MIDFIISLFYVTAAWIILCFLEVLIAPRFWPLGLTISVCELWKTIHVAALKKSQVTESTSQNCYSEVLFMWKAREKIFRCEKFAVVWCWSGSERIVDNSEYHSEAQQPSHFVISGKTLSDIFEWFPFPLPGSWTKSRWKPSIPLPTQFFHLWQGKRSTTDELCNVFIALCAR